MDRKGRTALCGGDPAKFTSMTGRFSDQVYMGDSVVCKVWRVSEGLAVMQVETQKGNVVLNQCQIAYSE